MTATVPFLNILNTNSAGQVNINPRRVTYVTTDSLTTITTAGYFVNHSGSVNNLLSTDILEIVYAYSTSTNSGVFGIFTVSIGSNGVVTLTEWINPGDVLLPTVTNYIAHAVNTNGQLSTNAANVTNPGNISAGLSGTAGVLTSFPATASTGSLSVTAVSNSGNTATVISNAAMGQASTISIPDPGVATSNFILADSAGTQTISTGSLALTVGNITATAGNLQAGSSGHAGKVSSFPAAGSKGSLALVGVANTGNTVTTISNAAMGQASVVSIPDPAGATANFVVAPSALVSGNVVSASGTAGLVVDGGLATNTLLTSAITTPDVGANLVTFNVTVGQAALAAGGHVALITSSGSKQYKILNLQINSGGTNFSGGGGNRLGQISDGTTVYSVIPATNLQTLTNNGWGQSTPLPYPASAAINTSTAAGANLFFAYSGGSADYTAGSIVVSGVAQRVA